MTSQSHSYALVAHAFLGSSCIMFGFSNTCCDCDPSCKGKQSYCDYKVEESRVAGVIEERSWSQFSLETIFLGKMKLLFLWNE